MASAARGVARSVEEGRTAVRWMWQAILRSTSHGRKEGAQAWPNSLQAVLLDEIRSMQSGLLARQLRRRKIVERHVDRMTRRYQTDGYPAWLWSVRFSFTFFFRHEQEEEHQHRTTQEERMGSNLTKMGAETEGRGGVGIAIGPIVICYGTRYVLRFA